jgi:hypothetical protein
MSACLEHVAFTLWPLGPGYCCSTHPPIWISVFLYFFFHWVWLWIDLFAVGLRVFWSCDQRSAICLSSWHLGHLGCQTICRARGSTFSCKNHFRFSGRISCGEPSAQIRAIGFSPSLLEWWILSGVKGGSTADVCAVRRSTYLQTGFFVVFPDSRHLLVSSEILGIGTKILDNFKVFVANCHALLYVTNRHALPYATNRPIIPGRNPIFCLLFIYF